MIKDVKKFCKYFYGTTLVPVSLFHGDRCLKSYPKLLYDYHFQDYFDTHDLHFSQSPYCHVTDSYAYLGYVKIPGGSDSLIIGPIFSTPLSNETLHTFMREFVVEPSKRKEIAQILSGFPILSYSHFLDVLSFLHLCLNDDVIDLRGNLPDFFSSASPDLSSSHMEQVLTAKEEQYFHNTYLYEQEICLYIQMGDENGLKSFLSRSTSALMVGVMAKTPLRQSINTFIGIITLATRAAIAGGLDIEHAYQLSDIYIQECEGLQDINAIALLSHSMLLDFARRVANSRIPHGISAEIFQCVQFISCHTADSISIDDVVDHVGRSRSYLTKKFKKELGFDMGAFIMARKLEEAKSLLTYTTKSLSEISNYLCFSSQSYFQTAFRKKFGLTPLQYRNEKKQ